jgi:hypothetical protein
MMILLVLNTKDVDLVRCKNISYYSYSHSLRMAL